MVQVVTGVVYDSQGNIANFRMTDMYTPDEIDARIRDILQSEIRNIQERVLTLENDM